MLHRATAALAWLSGLAAFAWVRSGLPVHALGNSDAAGIVYNAEALLRGELPYVDTLEYKTPGTFFLFAALFGVFGRDILVLHVALWGFAIAGSLGVAYCARLAHPGSWHGPAVAGALYLLVAGHYDFNYTTWMVPAFVWGYGLVLASVLRPQRHMALAAGAVCSVAFLFKPQAATLAPAALCLWWWAQTRGPAAVQWHTLLHWIAGAGAVLVPLLVLYGWRGELGALFYGVFPIQQAQSYQGQLTHDLDRWTLLTRVASQAFELFPTLVVLGGLGLGRALWPSSERVSALPAGLLLLSGLGGVVLGGSRFYPHYLLQYIPGLAVMAVYPLTAGVRGGAVARQAWIVATLSAALWVGGTRERPMLQQPRFHDYNPWMVGERSAPARAGDYIRAHSAPEDSIFVWSWSAWPVYYWSDRRAPGRIYKSLGLLTTFNTNSAFHRSSPLHFVPGPMADEVLGHFRSDRPPRFFVFSDHYRRICRCNASPYREFKALNTLIRQRYRRVRGDFGNLTVYERRPTGRPRTARSAVGTP